MDGESIREQYEALTYRDLQKEAKKIGIKSNGTKEQLLKDIVRKLLGQSSESTYTSSPASSSRALDSTFAKSSPILNNSEFILTSHPLNTRYVKKEASKEKDAKDLPNLSPFNSEREYSKNQKENTPNFLLRKEIYKSPIRQYFNVIHNHAVEQMIDIETDQKLKEERRDTWTKGWTSRLNELSKPKTPATPIKCDSTPTKYSSTPKKYPSSTPKKYSSATPKKYDSTTPSKNASVTPSKYPSTPKKYPSATPQKYDSTTPSKNASVKTPIKYCSTTSKNVLKSRFNRRRSSSVAVGTLISKRTCRGLTYPKVTPLLEELAEPKTPPRSPSRCRSSSVSRVLYKPRGRFTFVDTTKMTNAEFKEYNKKRLAENRNF